ncbi:MAG: hypothetical protein VX438_12100 [Planctomycetota bacterium]|jgi:NMD protein affecting ribosome stability and mRNA decay|nr:hypothetical protein [Planctomycetota bacterium]
MNALTKALLVSWFSLALSGCQQFSVQSQLEKYAEQQREDKKIPRKITNTLTLIDIQTGDKELIQIFTIKGPKGKIHKKIENLESDILTELKKNKSQIKQLSDYKIMMTFKYLHDPSNEVLHVFQVKPWSDL